MDVSKGVLKRQSKADIQRDPETRIEYQFKVKVLKYSQDIFD